MRLGVTRGGLVGAGVYLCLAVLWITLADPAGTPEIYAIWFAALALVELMIPGVANQVTLGRAYLAAPALAYSYQPSTLGLLALTVALAGLSDLVDGTVARRFDRPTQFGGALDPIVDGIYFGGVALGLAAGHAYPRWLAAVVILRYGLPAAVGGLLMALGRQLQIRHTLLGQVSTAVNAILLGGVALLRGLGQDAAAVVAVAEVVIPLAAVGTFANLFWSNRASVAGPDG